MAIPIATVRRQIREADPQMRKVTPTADGQDVSEWGAAQRKRHAEEAAKLRAGQLDAEGAERLGRLLKERGRDGLGDEAFDRGMLTLRAYYAENGMPEPKPTFTEEQKAANIERARQVPEKEFGDSFFADYLRELRGLGSAGLTVANSAIAEPVAGTRGLVTVLTGGSVDEAVSDMDRWRKAVTFVNPNQSGARQLRTIAEPLMKLDRGAMNFSEWAGMGNPAASTAIYSTLMGAVEVAGLKGSGKLKVTPQVREAKRLADSMGVKVNPQEMPEGIIAAAREMSSEVQAQNAGRLQEAMQRAAANEKLHLEKTRRAARRVPAYLDSKNTRAFGSEFKQRAIEDGWDLEIMPSVRRRLEEIENISGQTFGNAPDVAGAARATDSPGLIGGNTQPRVGGGPQRIEGPTIETAPRGGDPRVAGSAAPRPDPGRTRQEVTDLKDWITIRNRITKDINRKRERPNDPITTDEKQVLERLARTMDDALEKQFNTDMIQGSPEALQAWRTYEGARRQVFNNFDADRTIAKLIDSEASPQQIKRWIMGANAVNAGPQMQSVVTRLKEVLGKDHPAIEGIRQDFLFDVMEPLYKTEPDLRKFVENVDTVLRRNPQVLEALDMKPSQFMPLRNLAQTSMNFPPSKVVALIEDWGRAFARLTVGHAISKAALRVSFAGNLWKRLRGEGQATQKQILADFAGAQFEGPAISRMSETAGQILQSAFLADLSGQGKEKDDE